MFKIQLFIVSIFVIVIPVIHAQQLVFQNIGVEDGVPATEVYQLFQDSKGYVWVFTEYGIAKHNGTVFKPVCTNIPFGQSVAYAVTELGGNIYFLNSKGAVYQISNDSAFQIRGLESITKKILDESQTPYDLYFDNDANLYLSTFYETFKVLKTDYSVSGVNTARKQAITKSSQPRLVKVDEYQNERGHLKLIDADGEFVRNLPDSIVWSRRNEVLNTEGGFYLAWRSEVNLTKKDGTCFRRDFGVEIICFHRSPDGYLWVGLHNGGLYKLDRELNIIEHHLDILTVSDVLFDDQSGMWVSTIEKGVFYCQNTDRLSYSNISELNDRISMLKVIDQKLFIGTANGKLFVKENERITQINLLDNSSYITDIIVFDGAYYLGTKNSILTISLDFKVTKPLSLILNCHAFAKDSEDELVMFSGDFILRKKKGTSQFAKRPNNEKSRSVVKRPGQPFVIANPKGCFLFKSSLHRPDYLKPLADKNISKLKLDCLNNIWICTKGDGLYCLSPKNKLTHYSNLPSLVINDIVFSENGMVLLSTNKGAYATTYKKLFISSDWELMLDGEILSMTFYKNDIYIATKTGLTKLNPRKLFQEKHFRFHLESIVVEGKKMLNGYFKTTYNQNNITFNFDLLAYAFQNKGLVYRLKGQESFFGEVNGTQLQLQNLNPGYYTLIVSPKINMKNEGSQAIVLTFYIAPAFWQTKTFVIIIVLLGLGLILGTGKWILYRARKKQERKAVIEKVLIEYRLTALKAQINPHFMSNSLVAIQQLILTEESDKANLYIAKFTQLIRYLLNYSDQSVSSLTNELEMIDLYVELEQLRFSDRFLFVKHIDPAINLNELYIPALITQPLIENAIWHGLLPLPIDKKPQLTLSIALKADQLQVSIEDNGVVRIAETNDENAKGRKSKGSSLIRNRLDSLNQLYKTNGAQIEFIELLDEANNKIGTCVQVVFSKDILKKFADE